METLTTHQVNFLRALNGSAFLSTSGSVILSVKDSVMCHLFLGVLFYFKLMPLPEQAGLLYIDGHVRVYNGSQTKLPRHYVACQRLCLRSTTDYWVNAMDGQPFFVVNTAVDPLLHRFTFSEIIG